MSFLHDHLQPAEKARREEKRARDIRLGKVGPSNVFHFPDQTTKPVNRELQTQDAAGVPHPPVKTKEPVSVPITENDTRYEEIRAELTAMSSRVTAMSGRVRAVEDGLKNVGYDPAPLALRTIILTVAKLFNLGWREIRSERRQSSLVYPRHIAMYLCKELTPHSFPEIGRAFGGRDHTTVLAAVRKIKLQLVSDVQLGKDIERVRSLLTGAKSV